MKVRAFYAYTRVSTVRQGEQGVSLQEQRDAIERYAARHGLTIGEWFEDRLTATVQGRPGFDRMLLDLSRNRAAGVIIHKIDRSARNLGDWNEVTELIDRGFDVHVAHDAIDLRSRSGRLTGDILAVMAADYSRNLREEVKKGINGRLKQGFFPRPAPFGYRDNGGGKPKTIDPITGPVVQRMFELYSTGRFSLRTLAAEFQATGLHGRRAPIRLSQLNRMLRNPFYAGTIRLEGTGESFAGAHEPLIRRSLFDRVQEVLSEKGPKKVVTNSFVFRRLLTCAHCRLSLVGERQKGRVYYRCHTKGCPTTTVREDVIEDTFVGQLRSLRDTEAWRAELSTAFCEVTRNTEANRKQIRQTNRLQLAQLADQQKRLTDAYLDGAVDRSEYEQRKTALIAERQRLEETITGSDDRELTMVVNDFLELAGKAHSLYQNSFPDDRRNLFETMTSNRVVDGRTLRFTLTSPFSDLVESSQMQSGEPHRDTARTVPSHAARQLIQSLIGLQDDFRRRVQTVLAVRPDASRDVAA